MKLVRVWLLVEWIRLTGLRRCRNETGNYERDIIQGKEA